MTDVWTALEPPDDAPTPTPPEGYTFEPVKDGDRLLGYLARYTDKAGAAATRTLAWARNGTPESATWRWMPLPQTAPQQAERAPTPEHDEPEPAPDATPADEPTHAPVGDEPPFPFTMLGHDHGVYYYLGHASQQVTQLKASAHTSANLMQLAPISFWARRWQAKRGFDVEQAASDLMTIQHNLGVYDPKRQRGRGAWWDKETGAATIHLGDRLLLKGRELGLHEHGTKHIYECAVPLAVDMANPLRVSEANELARLCEALSWENPHDARLLAGWIVCAQIPGALRWRPNVWIQGERGAGKSYVVDQIVARSLGDNRKPFVGGTSEAGIRALLKADAISIVLDDVDAGSERGREQNQKIFELMRVFSGDDGGDIVKASQSGGEPNRYRVRSCFIYCSIVVELDKSADKSRVAVLKLVKRQFEPGQLDALQARINKALPADYAGRLYARCINLIPMIRKNADTFAQAIGSKTGEQRSADLYGHLFAGVYSLHSDGLITPEEAAAYVGSRAEVIALMKEQKQEVAENNEGERCLSHLLEHQITDSYDGRMMRASVQELLQRTRAGYAEGEHAEKLLRRYGVIVKGERFYVANDHSMLRDIYRKSSWPHGWGAILKTIPCVEVAAAVRFGARVVRAASVPFSFLSDAQPPPPPPDDDFPAI